MVKRDLGRCDVKPGTGSDGCPNEFHCAACHELYFGYVSLCSLHADAPDLLEVLKAVVRVLDGPPGALLSREEMLRAGSLTGANTPSIMDRARAAIAKAEGKAVRS